MTCCTAAGISASSQMMNGAWPPSSSDTRFTVRAAFSYSLMPISVLPVKVSLRTRASSKNTSENAPGLDVVTTWNTSGGSAGLHPQLFEANRGQRRLLRRLEDHGASRSKRGRNLARHHRRREIPRRDRVNRANRLARGQQALVARVRRDDLAVGALRFFGVPLDEGRGVFHLAARFGDGLSHFLRHQAGERRFVAEDQLVPLAENRRALECGLRFPRDERRDGFLDRLLRVVDGRIRSAIEDRARGGVDDVEGCHQPVIAQDHPAGGYAVAAPSW